MKSAFSLDERLVAERELAKEISAQIEKIEACITKCLDTLSRTHEYFESHRLVTPPMSEYFSEIQLMMGRTRDILDQRIKKALEGIPKMDTSWIQSSPK